MVRVKPRGRAIAVLILAPLLGLVAGCGARFNQEQRAVMLRNHGGGLVASQSTSSSSGLTSGTVGAGVATSVPETGVVGQSVGAVGPTASGGEGETSGSADVAPSTLPCAQASNAPGVTADAITMGSISTLSGPVPGFGASSAAGTRAYVAYLNSNGGVCGRRVVLKEGDDGADNGRFRAIVTDMADQVFGLVGGIGIGDAGGADAVSSQNIPAVTTAVNAPYMKAPPVFNMNPGFADVNQAPPKFRWLYDQGVRKAAIVYASSDAGRTEMLGKQKPQMQAAGIQVVNEQELPLSTLSFDAAARAVANSGADYMLFLHEAGADASMAKSMRDTGYQLKFAEYLTAYASTFIDIAGDAAEGAVSWIRALPNEDASPIPEQQAFLKWMAQTAPDTVVDTFAADSWAASKAFFQTLAALPGAISRDAFLEHLRSVKSFDADGFFGTIDLGDKFSNGCMVAMRVVGGRWQRLTPASGFLC